MRMLKAISMKRFRAALTFRRRQKRRFEGADPRWGPFVELGKNLRLQAKAGHRAAVVELRPGLFIVAEVPKKSLRPEFGVIPLLAPLVMTAARAALKNRRRRPTRPELPGPVAEWADEQDLDEAVEARDG